MKITIEELPESKIAYFRNVGEYGEKQNKELMESFKKWAQLNGVFDNSTILGIPQDNPEVTPKEECRYDVCVIINKDLNVAEPAQVGEFSGGKYAVFLLDHTKEAINEFWVIFFSEIEKNNLSIREQPIVERYTSQMIDNHLCEILVPIQ
ncbi:AraC family transcriptional regulator [Bacillus pseudomycoides]|uniref:AraC family transcriptional regulator n=1 Tax=Bacillus pseudomycoides TaxID=64104 RepID=UPI000BED3F13|nr:GyrI-like domain-containing protein [Bacillus pseudomycoides]PEE40875.1 transcriptional regulator [Bacillus pseudomycoides]PGA79176.1 transcriptional regulator [Bacillus pseudomycoides]PHF35296.1 transcriptional regulator [Bacillus pseudomycoides]